MDKVIWIEGAKMYLLPDGVAPKLGVDIDIRVGTEFHWYREAPERLRFPKKRKQKQVAQPKKVVIHEGEKYYLTPAGECGIDGDVIAKPGVEYSIRDAFVDYAPINGWRVYRRNETRTNEGVEYFRVRSGNVRRGDRVGPLLSAAGLVGDNAESLLSHIWRPVPVNRVVLEWPNEKHCNAILTGWASDDNIEAARRIRAILDWAKENQP